MIGTQRDPRFTVGMIAEWRGQQYQLIDIGPHRRRDGRDSTILIWRSRCLECGDVFETITPQREFKYPNRRCPAHVKNRRATPLQIVLKLLPKLTVAECRAVQRALEHRKLKPTEDAQAHAQITN